MKSIFKYLTIILCITLVVGCGTKQKEDKLPTNLVETMDLETTGATMVCSVEFDYSDTKGYTTGSLFAVYADDQGIVTKVVSREMVASNDDDILALFEDSLNRNYDAISQYGGYTYKVEIEGNVLTSNVTIDYTETDLKTMATENEDLKMYLNENNQLTLEKIKAMYVSSGVECN